MKTDLKNFFITTDIFRRLGVRRIGVFGSYARDEKYNDIDLLLDEDPGFEKRELLKSLVEDQFRTDCDIVIKDKLEPILFYYINKDLQYVEG